MLLEREGVTGGSESGDKVLKVGIRCVAGLKVGIRCVAGLKVGIRCVAGLKVGIRCVAGLKVRIRCVAGKKVGRYCVSEGSLLWRWVVGSVPVRPNKIN